METKDILSLIPDGKYDPSEVVLIGSHMDPSPTEETIRKMHEAAKNKATDTVKVENDDRSKLATGNMRIRSDFAKMIQLFAHYKMHENEDGEREWTIPTISLIYAYGYEGHIYRLASPRIMIVQGIGEPFEVGVGSEIPDSLTGQLYMWRLSKHDQTISIEVESGTLETLVLEGNQPGNRAVNSYAAHMQMSHRGGH